MDTNKGKEMSEAMRAVVSQLKHDELQREWAAREVAAMLKRVKSVCITEYQWWIDALRGS